MPNHTSSLTRRSWQSRAALRLALFHAVFVGSVTLLKSGTNAVFLSRENPHNLPWLYVAVAIVVWITTSSLAKKLQKSTPGRLLQWTASLFAVLFLLVIGLCAVDVKGSTFALYILVQVYATVLSILFWSRLSDAFGARDQKNVVGMISAGGMVGSIFGGLAIHSLASYVGTLLPMAVSVVGVVLSLPILKRVRSGQKKRATSVGQKETSQSASHFLVQNRYAKWVALLVVMLAATGAVTDFVFRIEVVAQRTEAELAGIFGVLNATVGVLISLFQLFFTKRLLARMGLFMFGAMVPAVLVLGSTAYLFIPSDLVTVTIGLLFFLKGVEMAGAFSLNTTMVTLLYNPMPAAMRSQMRALIDGAVKKGGAAAAGLILAGVAFYAPQLLSPAAVILPGVLCLILLPIVRRRYLTSLDDKLGLRKKRTLYSAIDVSDKITRDLLMNALQHQDHERVLHVIDVLGVNKALDEETLVQLLHHDNRQVREHALQFFPSEPTLSLEAELLQMGEDSSRRQSASFVRALRFVGPIERRAVVERFIDDDDPAVVAASLEVLLANDPDHALARTRLDTLVDGLAALPATWKREVARTLGALDESRYDAALALLLHDNVPSVQKVAIQAAGREHHEPHLPHLVELLANKPLRQEVRRALTQYGVKAVSFLASVLDDKSVPVELRISIPRVLRDIGGDEAVAALLHSNSRDLAALQLRIAEMLVEIMRNQPHLHVDKQRTRQAIYNRLDLYVAYRDAAADFTSSDSLHQHLLLRTLSERQDQNLRIGLYLLGIHHGIDRTMTIYRAVRGDDKHARQDALELLDVELMGDPVRGRLLDVLEGTLPKRTSNIAARLASLCRSPDPLLRALAKHAATSHGYPIADFSGLQPMAPGAVEGEDMDMTQVERLFALEHVDLFEGLSVDELTSIASIADDQKLAANEVLYREGDDGDALFVVVEGEIVLHKGDKLLMTLVEGESIGQTSFLDRGPRPVKATATSKGASLMRISRGDLMDLMADRPGLMRTFFGVIGARLRVLLEKTPTDENP